MLGCAHPQGELFAPVDPPIVWPRAPETPRIRWVGQISNSSDLKAGVPASEVALGALRGPRPPIQLTAPSGVALLEPDLLAVTEAGAGVVHLIDLKDRTHRLIFGWEGGRFKAPIGVAWADRRLFVTDAAAHTVVELDVQGRVVSHFGEDDLTRPVGIVYVASRDRLYVVDGGAHDIAVFTRAGELVSRIGGPGSEPGRFNYPTYIAWDGKDRLVVSDSGNFRVQWLSLDGQAADEFGAKGDGAGDLSLPKGIALDRDGHVYVVDARFENVQIFEPDGRLLLAFGREGTAAGEFSLPAGLFIDKQDRIWVADSANGRIQVFEYLRSGE